MLKKPWASWPASRSEICLMAQHQDTWPVSVLCEVLEVSRSGFYAYRQGQATVESTWQRSPGGTGEGDCDPDGPQLWESALAKPLQAEGSAVGREYKARRLMQQAGVSVRRRKRCPVTTDSRHGHAVAPNLLARQFDVAQPDTVWVGDITYVWTAEGWEYLAVLLDLHSRKVVGWAMQSRIDAALVQAALRMALGRRRPRPG